MFEKEDNQTEADDLKKETNNWIKENCEGVARSHLSREISRNNRL